MTEAAVVCALSLIRKTAGGELFRTKVVCEAIAAFPLPRTGIIRAVASAEIFFFSAIHGIILIPFHKQTRLSGASCQ